MGNKNSHIGGILGVGGSAVNSAMHAMAGISDGSEDPEERRKRIEAEENASNLGTLVGVAAGLAMALAESEDTIPDDLNDEQEEISMKL